MGVALQEASGGDIDLGDRRGTADGHLVVEKETRGTDIRPLVLDRGVVRDRAEESVPEIPEFGESVVDSGTLELTSESDHVTKRRKMGGLGPDIDLESVVSIRHTVNGCDHGLDIELCRQRGEM